MLNNMRFIGRWYSWFWFHTEWYLTPINRRPYTFIFRDWLFRNLNIFIVLVALFYIGMLAVSIWYGTTSTIIVAIGSFILAHLIWGSAWIEGQQEYPEYLGEDND